MAEEFKVPATGVLAYKHFIVDPGFKEDVWVQAAECRPGNRAVVHHILVYIQAPGKPLYARDGTASTLVGWAPGDMPAVYAPGTAKHVPAGSKLVFEVHYTPNGIAQTDRSSVGLIFAKKPPEHAVETNILANLLLRIPPGAARTTGQMDLHLPPTTPCCCPSCRTCTCAAPARSTSRPTPTARPRRCCRCPTTTSTGRASTASRSRVAMPKGTKLTWTGALGQLGRQPAQPRPDEGGALGPADVGRDAERLDGGGVGK